jgi:hypothetical protein
MEASREGEFLTRAPDRAEPRAARDDRGRVAHRLPDGGTTVDPGNRGEHLAIP